MLDQHPKPNPFRMNVIFISLGLLLFTQPCWAEIYKWVDEDGVAHFTDDPAQIPKIKPTKKPRRTVSPKYETSLNTFWDIYERESSSRASDEEFIEEPVNE